MRIKKIEILLCQACLDGDGDECHTPGCALFLHNSPGHEIMPELYTVLDEWDETKTGQQPFAGTTDRRQP